MRRFQPTPWAVTVAVAVAVTAVAAMSTASTLTTGSTQREMMGISDTPADATSTTAVAAAAASPSSYESPSDPSSPLLTASSSVRTGQLALIPSLFCLTLISSLLPWWMQRFARATLLMRIGACFAAGIMIGSAFVHLLPDAADAWSSYFNLAGSGGLRQSRGEFGYFFEDRDKIVVCKRVRAVY